MDETPSATPAPELPAPTNAPGADPNVYASVFAAVYEGGRFLAVKVEDVLHNEVACRQLVNSLNASYREAETLRSENETLRVEGAAFAAQPRIALVLAVASVIGAVLIGFGTSELSAPPPTSRFAGWTLFFGIVLTVLGSVGNVLIPQIIRGKKKAPNA